MRALGLILSRIDLALLGQRGHLLPWAPVFLGLGIGLYFALPAEPAPPHYAALALAGLVAALAARRWPGGFAALGWALALLALGVGLAGVRASHVAAPVLGFRYYGPIEGRIVGIDRSASDALRITLDDVSLQRTAPERRPGRVRISLHGGASDGAGRLRPGQRIMTTGHLSPPQGPVEPGGFDFRRHAWFQGLGGVGYTRTPVMSVTPPEGGLWVLSLRMWLSRHVRAELPGDIGGFAAAVTTGDRSGVSLPALEALRASNLAHLLAISGLHMGLLAGFVFAALRLGIALVPPLALRVPGKKIAAVGALVAGAGYLALSGGSIATERAFIMVAVALCAVLVDRRALSLRAVALAAMIVMALRPESLLSPGFQMSFAATTALVAVFGWLRDLDLPRVPHWARPVLGVVISSAVAGAATAPIGAAHFNALAHYGLLANLLSVPVMGSVVVPSAVLALCLAPLGLSWLGLMVMGWGLNWILMISDWVAGMEGARGWVASPSPVVLPLLVLGILWLILWQGRARVCGLTPAALALVLWSGAERPAVLIADTGGLVGVMTPEGRALSKPRGGGFIASNWLENDGDGADQPTAAGWMLSAGGIWRVRASGREIIHLTGKRAASGFSDCAAGQVIVAPVKLDLSGDCEIYDAPRLRGTGSIRLTEKGFVTARDMAGDRIWNRPPQRQ